MPPATQVLDAIVESVVETLHISELGQKNEHTWTRNLLTLIDLDISPWQSSASEYQYP